MGSEDPIFDYTASLPTKAEKSDMVVLEKQTSPLLMQETPEFRQREQVISIPTMRTLSSHAIGSTGYAYLIQGVATTEVRLQLWDGSIWGQDTGEETKTGRSCSALMASTTGIPPFSLMIAPREAHLGLLVKSVNAITIVATPSYIPRW